MSVAVILCTNCGSHLVDVVGWHSARIAVFRCSSCDNETHVSGFTVGRVWSNDEPWLVRAAITDAALPGGRA